MYGRPGAPAPYKALKEVPNPDLTVTFTVALKQQNVQKLQQILFEVSNPKHENYAKYLTREELRDIVSPPEEHRQLVRSWLEKVAGSSKIEIEDRWDAFRVSTSVAVAERLFETKLGFFVDASSPSSFPIVKFVGSFSVPSEIAAHVEMVTGITEFPHKPLTPKVFTSSTSGTTHCNTPYTLKRIYNMSDSVTVTNGVSTQGPFSHDGHQTKTIGFGESDLAQWQIINNLPQVPVALPAIGDAAALYGTTDSSLTGGEALLDVQMMTSFAPGSTIKFWIIADWMYEYANEIVTTPGSPWVNSMSYGYEETNQCAITNCTALGFPDSVTYIQRTDVEFMKCGVLGYTLLAASGDNGVEPNRFCTEMFQVYPASSLYVLTVGATAVVKSDTGVPLGSDAPPICSDPACECSTSQVEQGAMYNNSALFDTGGGFSHYNPRPSWQDKAVSSYLNSGVQFPKNSYWNSTNRGYPDVAACGGNIAVYQKGAVTKVAGTSASCPIWAGMITIFNDDRLNNGLPPLGFINPLLYQIWEEDPTNFNDITEGANGGHHYAGEGACTKLNFYATKGWDAVSGLGSPNFGRLRESIQKLSQ